MKKRNIPKDCSIRTLHIAIQSIYEEWGDAELTQHLACSADLLLPLKQFCVELSLLMYDSPTQRDRFAVSTFGQDVYFSKQSEQRKHIADRLIQLEDIRKVLVRIGDASIKKTSLNLEAGLLHLLIDSKLLECDEDDVWIKSINL